MITQRRLLHLLVLAQHAHFGRAAQALNISQPALTKSIQALETELGVVLLDRQHGAISLTAFGELVVARGKSWLTAEDDLRREIAMLADNNIGSLRVAIGPYPSIMSGFTSAAQLLSKHPSIRMMVQEASWFEIINLLNAQSIDLGITEISRLIKYEHFITEVVGQHCGYFFVREHGAPFNGRAVRGSESCAGSLTRYCNLHGSAHPDCSRGSGIRKPLSRRQPCLQSPSRIRAPLFPARSGHFPFPFALPISVSASALV